MTGCRDEPHLHVFAERAMWRWAYHEPAGDDGSGLQLQSSIAFTDAEEARSAATAAYPGMPVADAADEQSGDVEEQQAATSHRCRRTVPAALVAVVLATTAVIILRQRAADRFADHGRRPAPSRARSRRQLRGRHARWERNCWHRTESRGG